MAITFISREQELEFPERLWGKKGLRSTLPKSVTVEKRRLTFSHSTKGIKALFVEVKWKDLREREAHGILKDLRRKAGLVGLDGWGKTMG